MPHCITAMAVVTVASLLHSGAALAQKANELTEEQFVQQASAMNLAEINLGKIAARHANQNKVKSLGRQMVRDHTQANAVLLLICAKAGLSPAKQAAEESEAVAEKLQQLKGPAFDRAYLDHIILGHEKAIPVLQQQASQGRNQVVRAFAAKALPVAQEHLKLATKLAAATPQK